MGLGAFFRMLIGGVLRLSVLLACSLAWARAEAAVVWPTPSKLFAEGAKPEEFLQPTASGKPMSGAFGDVRSDGWQFHEGIDIKPAKRSKKGEALDSVYCAMDGKIAMINTVAGNSGYGRYVVVTHGGALDADIYTLYAHLSEVDSDISVGSEVKAGDRLGRMGRSAYYGIPKSRAHLHFEVGLRISDSFDRWYYSKKFKEKNFFGNYNGLNLEGFDPLAFFQAAKDGKLKSVTEYVKSLPTALVVRVYTRKTPDFAKIYPSLTDLSGYPYGWDIHFTWHGLPKKMERIKNPRQGAKSGEVEIRQYSPKELSRKCKRMVRFDKQGNPVPTNELKDKLRKIFP